MRSLSSSLVLALSLSAVSLAGCSEDSSSGEGPLAGSAGSGVTAGTAGSAGIAGQPGAGGSAGSVAGSGTSGQGGAAAGASGTGGASAGTGGAAGSGGGKVCGGPVSDGNECGPDEFCDYANDFCGAEDSLGTCQPRPTECPVGCPAPEFQPCDCDGKKVCSECNAQLAGVDIFAGSCGVIGGGGGAGSGGAGGGN